MKNFLGLAVVALGIVFLLQQLDVPGADHLVDLWWPLIIVAAGVIAWASNRRTWFGPLIIVFVGLILLLDQLKVFPNSAWNYFWPIIIILIGGRILVGKSWEGPKHETGDADANVVFSGVDRKITGTFNEGNISAWFGGAKMDLRGAQMGENPTLHVFAAFGGIEVWVPKNVRVVTKVMPLFGGADDKTHPENAQKTLTVTGTALFGGVSVKN